MWYIQGFRDAWWDCKAHKPSEVAKLVDGMLHVRNELETHPDIGLEEDYPYVMGYVAGQRYYKKSILVGPEADRPTREDLARAVLSMAADARMPETYWHTDNRVSRACEVLGMAPERAYRQYNP